MLLAAAKGAEPRALARVRAIVAQGKGQYLSSRIHLMIKAILPDNAGRKADVLRTRRADLMVADICGNVGRKGKGPLGFKQAIAGCATTKLRPKNNNDDRSKRWQDKLQTES